METPTFNCTHYSLSPYIKFNSSNTLNSKFNESVINYQLLSEHVHDAILIRGLLVWGEREGKWSRSPQILGFSHRSYQGIIGWDSHVSFH